MKSVTEIRHGQLYLTCALVMALLGPPAFHAGSRRADLLDAQARIELYTGHWRNMLQTTEALAAGDVDTMLLPLVDGLFDLEHIAPRVIPDIWEALTPRQRDAFVAALKTSIRDRVLPYALPDAADRMPTLTLANASESPDAVTLGYAVDTRRGPRDLSVTMTKTRNSEWKIVDATLDDITMLGYYRDLAAQVLDEYSFPYLVAQLGDGASVILEDFEAGPVDELPAGWQWKDKDDDKHKPYRVREEDGNRYLEATDAGESVILAKDIAWNLKEYPYVTFRWRGHEIPEGADERYDDKIDSAAGIYFVYRQMLGLIPESAKYVWSATLPIGSAVRRSGVGKPWMIVAESGKDRLGEWHTYVFNLDEAYRATFGGRPPRRAVGIAILSDANSMKSHAYVDYDDIRALRTAGDSVDSGVHQILQAVNPER